MTRDRKGDQTEHTDRGVGHHHVGHTNHRLADEVKDRDERPAVFAQGGKTEAEHDRKEDDLQHGALTEGFHGVDRDDVQKRFNKRRRRHGLGLETFGRQTQTDTRVNPLCKQKTAHHCDGGKARVADQDLHGNTAEFADVRNVGGTGDQRCDHQGHNHHADQTDEQRTQGLQIRLGELCVDQSADDHT